MTQVVPYLMDVCTADPSNCLMAKYNAFCFANRDEIALMTNVTQDVFTEDWANTVYNEFPSLNLTSL